uniref:Histone H2A n=1 Tax=Panagrolaimus superbus TaxID=310955 RepID=A0A914ZC02_9BILA
MGSNVTTSKERYAEHVENNASIYLAAVLENLTAEVLELAGNAARHNKKARITPRHIQLAVRKDEELNILFRGVIINEYGVIPKTKVALSSFDIINSIEKSLIAEGDEDTDFEMDENSFAEVDFIPDELILNFKDIKIFTPPTDMNEPLLAIDKTENIAARQSENKLFQAKRAMFNPVNDYQNEI